VYRRSLLAWLVVAWLCGVGSAQAGHPFGWLGFGQKTPAPPVPRVIEVTPPAEMVGTGFPAPCLSPGGYPPAARAYPWGYFGARPGKSFVWHAGYYGDVSHWCQ